MPLKRQKHTAITVDGGYTQFLKTIEPVTIALVNGHFRADRDRYFEERRKELSVAWRCIPVEIGDDYFEADATIKIILKTASKKSKPAIEIIATYRLHIHAPKPISKEFIARFVDSEVRLLFWPYFREYASSVSGRMHIPPIMLPMATRG